MDFQEYLNNIDIYEVDKADYTAYEYRLPPKQVIKTTPADGWVIYKDVVDGTLICGVLTENIMATAARRYFIFNFVDESRLGPPKTVQKITLSKEDWGKLIEILTSANAERKE